MDIIHLLTTDTCKGCNAKFMSADKYNVSVCPSCVISALEQGTKYEWICNMDPPLDSFKSYRQIDPSNWLHVITVSGEYRIVSSLFLSLRNNRFDKVHYSNTLENCIKWVKRKQQ